MSVLQQNKVHRYNKRSISPMLIILSIAVVFSAGVAAVWQINSPPVVEPPPPVIDPSLLPSASSLEETPSGVAPSAAVQAPEESSRPNSDSEPMLPASESVPESVAAVGLVGEQPFVSSDYFDDAAFVGDSITTGIKLYDVMNNADVFAATGVGLDNILTKQAISVGSETLTIPEALDRTGPSKIYLMLGANSLGGALEHELGQYEKLVDSIVAHHPDSLVYIQSVLPINEPIFNTKYSTAITNAKIEEFNTMLCTLAGEKDVFYLDVASAFKDENGAMPADYTPDGIHINSAQYVMWFDYLKAHAIQIS